VKRLLWETPEEINLNLAKRVKNLRKRKHITQNELSERTGVSYGSIKLFERSGNISLLSLTKIAMELDCAEEIKGLFSGAVYGSIQEVIDENK
jgi:transcriptional regulator with XRE-family HTH domain